MNELLSTFETHLIMRKNHPSTQAFTSTLDSIANLLLAKLFYFEPATPHKEINYTGGKPSYKLRGAVLCRLPRNSNALKKLVERIHSFTAGEGSLAAEAMKGGVPLRFGEAIRTAVRDGHEAFRVEHVVETVEPVERIQNISIQLVPEGGGERMIALPISGFPCSFNGKVSPFYSSLLFSSNFFSTFR